LERYILRDPTDNLSIKLRHVDSDEDDGAAPNFIIEGTNNNCGPFGTGFRDYFCGTLTPGLVEGGLSVDTTPPQEGRAAELGNGIGMKRETKMTTMNIDWDIGGSGYVVSSVTGSYESFLSEYRALTEGILDLYSEWTDESFSQELRLSSPQDRRFRWMVGAYYLNLDEWQGALSGFPSTGPEGPFSLGRPRGGAGLFGPPVPPSAFPPQNVENTAIFGSVSFDVTDKLTVSLELRREEETLELESSFTQEAPPLDSSTPELAIATARPFGGATIPASGDFSATLPRFIVDYTLSDDTMMYASYAEGNNPGSLNGEVIELEPEVAFPNFQAITGAGYTVDQAELISYEIGAKHSLANGKGFINGAVYFMEWNNQAYSGFLTDTDSNGDGVFIVGSDRLGGGIDYIKNGASEVYGFEVAGAYTLNENWMISGNYNYNKTEIQDLEDAATAAVFGAPGQSAGAPIPRSPEHTAALALDFTMPAASMFGQEGEWFGRWDAWYQSESTTWVVGLAETEKAWLHNLRGGWRNDRYSVTAWIENVLDDDPVLAAQRTTIFTTFDYGYSLSLPQPRTFGITVSASFGQ
jgi:iron complex outermembrane receptor protein